MRQTSFARITVWLLPFLLAACATQPGAQNTPQPAPPSRLQVAEAMFAERCKTAGENIHRTAENVEGILLMKLRPEKINHGDQFRMDDPYGRDYGGDAYIKSLLRGFNTPPSKPTSLTPARLGYHYVESIDPKDGKRYRYTGSIKEVTRTSSILIGGDGKEFKTKEFVLDKSPAPGSSPRYGVTYDDISTREEREVWIAGSSLKVIDLKTNEVMAERVGYMIDRGQGDTSGGRSPWLLAADNACPRFIATRGASGQPGQTELFAAKILKQKLEN